MRFLALFAAMLVFIFCISLFQKGGRKEIQPPPPTDEPLAEVPTQIEPAELVDEAPPIQGSVLVQPKDDLARNRLHNVGMSIEDFRSMSPTDQAWVLEQTENSLKAAVINEREVALYIEELTALRIFAILDRQMDYSVYENEESSL